MRGKDLTGIRLGSLVFIKETDKTMWGNVAWLCRCDCGKDVVISSHAIIVNSPLSCGCKVTEIRRNGHKRHGHSPTSGHKGSPEYYSWIDMKTRCTNPKYRYYERYGELGMYEEWNSFDAFLSYITQTIGMRPPGKTLDRKDNNRGYFPGNIRWATAKEQANNRRNNHPKL